MGHARSEAVGRLAGALWIAGWLASLSVQVALDPRLPTALLLLTAAGVLLGLACLAVPWASLPDRWLHALPIAASLLIAFAIWRHGHEGTAYVWFYALVALFAAHAFRSRAAVAAQVAFASLALAAALLLPGDAAGAPGVALASLLTLAAAAALVTVQRERIETHSARDPLTGVGNYRMLQERLRYEIMRHDRHRRQFAVILLDLDRFKLVNEELGHLEGDRLLRAAARALTKAVRDQDTVARQGGDEFSVLLPETGQRGAAAVADRIDAGLERIDVAGAPLTASIGLAVFPRDGVTASRLLSAADAAQRLSKRRRSGPTAALAHRAERAGRYRREVAA